MSGEITDPAFSRMTPSTSSAINVGAVAIEQERAIAEAQGQLTLAKRFPRSMAQAQAEFLDACKSPEFAAQAFYSVPNRGSGPSIRFMEECARCYGNFVYGHRELSRGDGKSEIEVLAWDMERNNRSTRQVTVLHVVDTKNGPKRLTDQNDIDNRIANIASKQMRGRIAALMPKAMVAAGIAACKLTLAGNNDEPISARVGKMVAAFGKYGVNAKHLADYIGHTLDSVTVDELADLIGVFNAIREGAKPSEYFSLAAVQSDVGAGVNAALAATPAPPAPVHSAPAPAVKRGGKPPVETPAESKVGTLQPAQDQLRSSPDTASPPAEDDPVF
ncbi:MAG: hypothetical protein AB9M53_00840 [Leptothrix sp. (in: b-proteobacteria)]